MIEQIDTLIFLWNTNKILFFSAMSTFLFLGIAVFANIMIILKEFKII